MEQIAQAINELSSRDWVDYLAIFAPFVLSIVAVWVSISTAMRQNKIAMFERRMEALSLISKMGVYRKLLEEGKIKPLPQEYDFREYLGYIGFFVQHDYSSWDEYTCLNEINSIFIHFIDLLAQLNLIFKLNNSKTVTPLLKTFGSITHIDVFKNENAFIEAKQKYIVAFDKFENDNFELIKKQVKIR